MSGLTGLALRKALSTFCLSATLAVIAVSCAESGPTPTPAPTAAVADEPTLAPPPTPDAPATDTPLPGFDAEEYFADKKITIYVGHPPAGGYDFYARLAARYLPKHLPGDQSFVVRNVPGAGGVRIFHEMLIETDPEGYTVAVMHPRFIKRELVGDDVPDFDLDTIKVVGTASAAPRTSAMDSFNDYALTDNQWALFTLNESINARMNRLFVMHPDTPEHIYQIWVEAFRKTVADPEFVEDAAIRGYEVGYAGPDDLLATLENGKLLLQDPVLREGFITMAGINLPTSVAMPSICRPGMWRWTKFALDPIWTAIPSQSLYNSTPRLHGWSLMVELFRPPGVYEATVSGRYVGEYPTLAVARCAAAQAALRLSQ